MRRAWACGVVGRSIATGSPEICRKVSRGGDRGKTSPGEVSDLQNISRRGLPRARGFEYARSANFAPHRRSSSGWASTHTRQRSCPLAGMPRRLSGGTAGELFHVMNRGVRRSRLFHRPADYEAFLQVLCEAATHVDMRVLAYVLMPNHWHMVLWPERDGDLSKYVGWASMTHASRWHRFHGTLGNGAVYQGRFRAIPVQSGEHLLTVLRYVERNPLRAGLVDRAEDWPYNSASAIELPARPRVHPWPVERPANWLELVNQAGGDLAVDTLRQCVARSSPFGGASWCAGAIDRLGWRSGVRPGGRPKTSPGEVLLRQEAVKPLREMFSGTAGPSRDEGV